MTPAANELDLANLLPRGVTIFVGHFGSGKTEIAVNLAFAFRRNEQAVTLVDLDVVKPYFRSRGVLEELEAAGIELVAPRGERLYADLPIVVPEVRAAVGQAAAGRRRVLIDVGGAEVGARVLGSIPGLDDPARTDTMFVVNGRRPFAETPDAVVKMMREIEQGAGIAVSGLIANTHLMDESTTEIVCDGIRLAHAVSDRTGVPIRFAVAPIALAPAVAAADLRLPVLPIERHIMPPLDARPHGQRRRSSIL